MEAARASGVMITAGTPAFRRLNLGLFAAGFTTFALLYCVQPLLPLFTQTFRVSPAEASLSLSLSTGAMAAGLLFAGAVSDALGRKSVMLVSLLAASLLTLVIGLVPGWGSLLVLRALIGLALSGLPAVAAAFVAEEVDAGSIGLALGLFISGNAFGGMAGRLGAGVLADLIPWRLVIAGMGGLGLLASLAFWATLPASRQFQRRPAGARVFASLVTHLADPGLPWLFAEGFLLMGSFVTVYNYIGFRLLGPPYGLSQTAVAAVFLLYLLGMVGSAWIGQLGGRLGRRKVFWAAVALTLIGLALTGVRPLAGVIAGIGILTFAYFGTHSIASSWVGRRASTARGLAQSLYLFCYYLGSSLAGSAGGVMWARFGWSGVEAMVGAMLALALLIALRLARLTPLPQNAAA